MIRQRRWRRPGRWRKKKENRRAKERLRCMYTGSVHMSVKNLSYHFVCRPICFACYHTHWQTEKMPRPIWYTGEISTMSICNRRLTWFKAHWDGNWTPPRHIHTETRSAIAKTRQCKTMWQCWGICWEWHEERNGVGVEGERDEGWVLWMCSSVWECWLFIDEN